MVVAFVLSIGIMLLYVGINNYWPYLKDYFDGLTIAGFLFVLFGGLVLVSGFGAFYIFSYYPKRKKKENGYKETYTDYAERRRGGEKTTRINSIAYFLIGLFDIIISVIGLFL